MAFSIMAGLRACFRAASAALPPASEDLPLTTARRLPALPACYALTSGAHCLHLYPDRPLSGLLPECCDFVLIDPYPAAAIGTQRRLATADTLTLADNRVTIEHTGSALLITSTDPSARLTRLPDDADAAFQSRRREALARLQSRFGSMTTPLPPEQALDTLHAVNALLQHDAYRPVDSLGQPGAVVALPAALTPIIVGDLHAQLDNLLTLLASNGFLEALEAGTAALILLGDAVHPEDPVQMSYMDSSVLMMDLILQLKQHFPEQVFFLLGNHDSFAPGVTKGGVPQNLLWEERLLTLRGEAYRAAMELFYQRAPLLVFADDFIACHAGPPRGAVSYADLLDARQSPDLVHELTWNRLRRPGFPFGYTGEHVAQLRATLALPSATPLLVGHSPQSRRQTVWFDVGGIADHHIVYSAQPDQVGVFTRVGEQLVAQTYRTEPLTG